MGIPVGPLGSSSGNGRGARCSLMECGHSRSQVALCQFCWRVVMRCKSNNTDWAVQRNSPTEHQPRSWVSPQAAAQRRRPQALAPTRGTALSVHDLAEGEPEVEALKPEALP